MDEILTTALARYKCSFHRTVWRTRPFYTRKPVFVDRPLAQMLELGSMENTALAKLLPKALGPNNVIYPTPDTFKMNENGIYNAFHKHKRTLVSYNGQNNEITNQDGDMQSANHRRDEDKANGNDAPIWRDSIAAQSEASRTLQKYDIHGLRVWLWTRCKRCRAAASHVTTLQCQILKQNEQTNSTKTAKLTPLIYVVGRQDWPTTVAHSTVWKCLG